MSASTPTRRPVVHEPKLPTHEDIERLNKVYGRATSELQGVVFRLKAYARPFFGDDGEPMRSRPDYADIGRLSVLIDYLELDRWSLDQEIASLNELMDEMRTLKDEGGED